ncbi:hypothetical protein J3F83DRAFT_729874 [Trichoderma novae-zelandiae]
MATQLSVYRSVGVVAPCSHVRLPPSLLRPPSHACVRLGLFQMLHKATRRPPILSATHTTRRCTSSYLGQPSEPMYSVGASPGFGFGSRVCVCACVCVCVGEGVERRDWAKQGNRRTHTHTLKSWHLANHQPASPRPAFTTSHVRCKRRAILADSPAFCRVQRCGLLVIHTISSGRLGDARIGACISHVSLHSFCNNSISCCLVCFAPTPHPAC